MTVINTAELAELSRLDQAIMWAVMSINASNMDPKNTFISDNAAIRAESAKYVQWSVTQDDKGMGKFVYTALLPLVNPNPLKHKESLIERVWSYSPYAPDLKTEPDILGYGHEIPRIPLWADTTERVLVYLSIFASLISKFARLTKRPDIFWATIHPEYWAESTYEITDSAYGGTVTIRGILSFDWTSYIQGKSLIYCLNPYARHASDMSCNFPKLELMWDVPTVDLTLPPFELMPMVPTIGDFWVDPGILIEGESNSAGALIKSYSQFTYTYDDSLPGWYWDAMLPVDIASQQSGGNQQLPKETPKLIESLPVCREQDPSMISYANKLSDDMPKK